mgnify:CR=1 FL=1
MRRLATRSICWLARSLSSETFPIASAASSRLVTDFDTSDLMTLSALQRRTPSSNTNGAAIAPRITTSPD